MADNNAKRIRFNYLEGAFYFPSRLQLKALLIGLFHNEGHKVKMINYVFCSDAYLLAINREHLKHDTLTDIITFQYSQPDEPLLSEIYISLDRVKENAGSYATTFQDELRRVIIHGALHLCGYSDKTKKAQLNMRAREDHYLSLFVPRETK